MNKWIRKISATLCIILLFSTTGSTLVHATSELEESIKEKEEAVNQAEKEKQELEAGLNSLKDKVEGLENTKNSLEEYVVELDAKLTEATEKITELKDLITEKETEIEETQAQLDEAMEVEEAQYEAMKSRIQFMYEAGNKVYLELMLSANTFAELLNKADYIEQLSAYDRKMLDQYQATVEFIGLCKDELEIEAENLEIAKAAVEVEQENLKVLVESKQAEINKYESDINNQEAAMASFEAELAEQTDFIKAMEAAIAADKDRLNNLSYDGGMFMWPAPSYTRISSDYGWRTHPVYGDQRFHSGVDMAAPSGSPILAAYTGRVVAAAYSSSMGNYVMIDHGDSLYTIYMHASALYVTTGQSVSMGDKIAAVGTTGTSTGNHLHFGVRLNGEYVNPWNYLK